MSVNINGYALALFDIAKDDKALKQYKKDSADVLTLLSANNDYITLVSKPALTREARAAMVKQAFSGVKPMLLNLLAILAMRRQLHYATVILVKFIALVNADLGINEGVVFSAVPLTEDEVKAITRRAAKQLKLNELVLVNKLDYALVAGFRVEVKDEVIEDSVLSRLADLRLALMAKDENYGN